MRAICASSRALASASMTGPIWVEGSAGSPIFSSRAAPAIISMMRSATSSCTNSSRSAEQRCPAERNAEVTTSSATCSGKAVASTIMALMPPVSAMSGTIGPSLAASVRLMARATSVEPVNTTPAISGCAVNTAPIAPSPGTTCSAEAGTPASCSSLIASVAINGVCSAGLATTALPAISAAVTWPRKIASGKFQGEIATKTPRPRRRSSLLSPVGPGMASLAPNSLRPSAA